jgi:Cu(I)/Ag(I) efflux system membrane fusion protein
MSEIPALQWPAMTMDFVIADRRWCEHRPRSPVRFVFEARRVHRSPASSCEDGGSAGEFGGH